MIERNRWTITDLATGETRDLDGTFQWHDPRKYQINLEVTPQVAEYSWEQELDDGAVASQ